MLDMDIIEDEIYQIENDTQISFESVSKLASLYICREFCKNRLQSEETLSESVLQELSDILPAYQRYIETKKRYQKFEVVEQMLIYSMQNLCDEITEFVSLLYNNTESEAERQIIINMISKDLRNAI